MGYLKINTANTGEVIIDGSRILYVKKTGQAIDLITNLFEGNPSGTVGQIRISGSDITEETKIKFNQAVVDAQDSAFVIVRTSGDEVFQSVSLDPS